MLHGLGILNDDFSLRLNDLQAERNKAYLGGELGQQREKLNPSSASPGPGATGPPPDLWIGHVDQLELQAMDDGDETGETSIRSASSLAERSRQFGLPYSGKKTPLICSSQCGTAF